MMINFKFIDVLLLKDKNRNYTSLDRYNKTILKGNLIIVSIFMILFSFLALLKGYIYLSRSKKSLAE
jgi:hypothetical protein